MTQPEQRDEVAQQTAVFTAQKSVYPKQGQDSGRMTSNSSQSPACGTLAMYLPLGITEGRAQGSKNATALGKRCSQEPRSLIFSHKEEQYFPDYWTLKPCEKVQSCLRGSYHTSAVILIKILMTKAHSLLQVI